MTVETSGSPELASKIDPRNYELIERDGLETNLLEVSMGPHHPSTHGVFRMDVKLDGETVMYRIMRDEMRLRKTWFGRIPNCDGEIWW